ncbi:MAG: hypothetical protein ACU85V_19540 [Gammaproteobacteria bacterium]
MRAPLGAVLAWLMLTAGTAAGAAPVGDWAPLAGLSDEARRELAHVRRSRCLPDSREVTFPVYPDAVVVRVDWGRVKPECRRRDGWRELGGVALVSGDDHAAVAAWYAENLVGYYQYPTASGLMFVDAVIPDFLWDRDYYKYPNVSVNQADGQWRIAGYRTLIELNRPAPPEETQ